MKTFSEDEVKAALLPFNTRIRDVVIKGFSEWRSVANFCSLKGFGPVLYSRTIANYVFDAVARQAMMEFGSDPKVYVCNESQTVKLCFDNTVIARFKKADATSLGQNIPTQAVLDFIDPQQTLPGFPPKAVKIEFTWSANDLGTEIGRVTVVARDYDVILWSYDIEDSEADTGVTPLPLSPLPGHDEKAPLVAPKRKKLQIESE